MLGAEVGRDEVHHLQAVAQLLVHDSSSLLYREMAAGGEVEVFQTLPVPVEVWGVEQVARQVDHVAEREDLAGFFKHFVSGHVDVGVFLQVFGYMLD